MPLQDPQDGALGEPGDRAQPQARWMRLLLAIIAVLMSLALVMTAVRFPV